jgi:hypothetical protein
MFKALVISVLLDVLLVIKTIFIKALVKLVTLLLGTFLI